MHTELCPHKNHCVCPGPGCTVEFYRTCTVTSIEYIIGIITQSNYRQLSLDKRIGFIHARFGINMEMGETTYKSLLLAKIIRARLDITYEQIP